MGSIPNKITDGKRGREREEGEEIQRQGAGGQEREGKDEIQGGGEHGEQREEGWGRRGK